MTSRLLAVLLAPLLVTQGSFEGTLRMRTIDVDLEEPGLKESWLEVSPATLAAREDVRVDSTTMLVKNNVLRIQNKEGGEGYALMDFTRRAISMIDAESRSYFEMALPAGAQPQTQPGTSRATVKALGVTKKINGVNVTGYEVRSPDQIIRAWVTTDFPGLNGTLRSMAAHFRTEESEDPDDAAMAALMAKGFPVLVITLTDRTLRMEETVSIERSAMSPDMFKVPAGFTKRTMPGGP